MQEFSFPYQHTIVAKLPENIQQLVKAAEQASNKAYAPYSNFKVGAAVLLDDQNLITGANQENASFPAGICAERAALGSLDLNSGKKVLAIAVAYKAKTEDHRPLSPCGICRQTILEVQLHQKQTIAVYMCAPDGQIVMVEDATYLLPFYFSNEFLPTEDF